MIDLHVAIHPIKPDKWSVVAYVGECTSMEAAKELAEEVGKAIGRAFMEKKHGE